MLVEEMLLPSSHVTIFVSMVTSYHQGSAANCWAFISMRVVELSTSPQSWSRHKFTCCKSFPGLLWSSLIVSMEMLKS